MLVPPLPSIGIRRCFGGLRISKLAEKLLRALWKIKNSLRSDSLIFHNNAIFCELRYSKAPANTLDSNRWKRRCQHFPGVGCGLSRKAAVCTGDCLEKGWLVASAGVCLEKGWLVVSAGV